MKNISSAHTRRHTLDQEVVKQRVNQFLDDFYAARVVRSDLLDAHYGDLWRAVQSLGLAGGKRYRSYLLLLAYDTYGGLEYEAVLPCAAAQELLHLSLLIHDDIIDKDLIRYGQDNVAGLMKKTYLSLGAGDQANHLAASAALLAGDLLLSSAYEIIAASNLSDRQKNQATLQLSESMFFVAGGELLDTESGVRGVASLPLKIADYKTARYSFVTPLLTGALLADAPAQEFRTLEDFGVALGIAYQLRDDYLGMYGDEAVTGKSTLGDIREGKRTYLVQQALGRASAAERKLLGALLGKADVSRAEADTVRQIVERCGAKSVALEKIAGYAAVASQALQRLQIGADARKSFERVMLQATERTK